MTAPDITLSVVSHGQNALINVLLGDIKRVGAERMTLIITENIADRVALAIDDLPCPVTIIKNVARKGFGANHNAAFAHCETAYFCVCNPDIRLSSNPFPVLLDSLVSPRAAAAGPLVRSPAGTVEDSARRFPSLSTLARKLFDRRIRQDYPIDLGPLAVDWCAGMFLVFKSDIYRTLGGFDEAYYLYYEDVDICARLHRAGRTVIFNPDTEVIHDARRASRRDTRLAWHHLSSLSRFLWHKRP